MCLLSRRERGRLHLAKVGEAGEQPVEHEVDEPRVGLAVDEHAIDVDLGLPDDLAREDELVPRHAEDDAAHGQQQQQQQQVGRALHGHGVPAAPPGLVVEVLPADITWLVGTRHQRHHAAVARRGGCRVARFAAHLGPQAEKAHLRRAARGSARRLLCEVRGGEGDEGCAARGLATLALLLVLLAYARVLLAQLLLQLVVVQPVPADDGQAREARPQRAAAQRRERLLDGSLLLARLG